MNLEDDLDFDDELDIEDQIQNAVGELSQEDLDSEIDEETMLGIVSDELDNLDSLTTRDLKFALGEAQQEEEFSLEPESESPEAEELIDNLDEIESDVEQKIQKNTDITPDNDGVEALKKLLKALSNEDVAASMKGMKININITLGDN
jgi:uncharacterized membrane protein